MSEEMIQDDKQMVLTADAVPMEAPTDPNDRMIWLAIQGNADVEKLERLIALKNSEEARQAKKAFDEHFAVMQSEFTAVKKGSEAYNADKKQVMYKYAPLDVLQKHFNPIIHKHGFSYRWREEGIESGKRCVLRISGYGHSEENFFDVPKIDGTRQMNAIQVVGAMSTYGERYTFIGGFGLIIENEDNDATFEDGVKYAEQIKMLDAETDLEPLKALGKKFYRELKQDGDYKGAEIVIKEYNRRKADLGGSDE